MSIRLSERGVGNLILVCTVLTLCNTFAMAWFLMAYMPARAEADRRMAEILNFTRLEWEAQHARKVK